MGTMCLVPRIEGVTKYLSTLVRAVDTTFLCVFITATRPLSCRLGSLALRAS